jgi:hypothetical protein
MMHAKHRPDALDLVVFLMVLISRMIIMVSVSRMIIMVSIARMSLTFRMIPTSSPEKTPGGSEQNGEAH